MVVLNTLVASDGNLQVQSPRPRKFLFKTNGYDVSATVDNDNILVAVWDRKIKIGTIGLYGAYYTDVDTIYSVDSRISEDHQGKGIAYRVYEGLILRGNLSIMSITQSTGARKLWQRLAAHPSLAVYFVRSESRFFDSDIYRIELINDRLRVLMNNRRCDPYRHYGSLLLVRRNGPFDQAIGHNILLTNERRRVHNRFKRHDRHKLIGRKALSLPT